LSARRLRAPRIPSPDARPVERAPASGERQKSPHSGRRGHRSGSVRRLPRSLLH
jgi:hypothetical protein